MWRRFQFFDKELVPDEGPDSEALTMQRVPVTCSTSGRGTIILGDSSGCVVLVDRNLRTTPFLAYTDNISQMALARDRNVLVTTGHDEDGVTTLKAFAMDRPDPATGVPPLLHSLRIDPPRGYPTCLAASADLGLVAVGLASGHVVAVAGDIARSPRVSVVAALPDPVTAVAVRGVGAEALLYVATTAAVYAYAGVAAGRAPEQTVLDAGAGAEMRCAVATDDGDLVVGTREAIWFYRDRERGQCLGFEGDKRLLHWFRGGHLLVVDTGSGTGGSGAGGSSSSRGAGAAEKELARMNTVTVYDTRNKLEAFKDTRMGSVTHVLSEWGALFVLTADQKVWKLVEKDTQTKLELLFQKSLYSVAAGIAATQQFDQASIANIFTRYGDHLYIKKDYDGAIQQYNRTIGYLEPSYVIRKFLDAQRIHNLTSYLAELHRLGRANTDHTTLLLNCYTKLKDVEKLEQFLKTDAKEANFDVETAIKVCRQAGYHTHALELSRRYEQHDWYVRIELDDLGHHAAALEYLAQLPPASAVQCLHKYGKCLVAAIPQQTTALLLRLCSGDAALPPDDFVHIYVGQPRWLAAFLEAVVAGSGSAGASSFVYDTLLELYLRPTAEAETPQEEALRLAKAEAILDTKEPKYDPHQALVLCQRQGYRRGVMILLEHLKLYHEIMQQYMEQKDFANIIASCAKYSDLDPNLWMQVLSYFAGIPDNCDKEIAEVLLNIERSNLMPPLMVIQVLARKPSLALSAVKDYVVRRLQSDARCIADDERDIRDLRTETDKMRAEIAELRGKPHTFQTSKCSFCSAQLDNPAIHFLCGHSFHQRCLTESEHECPLCSTANRKILEINRAMHDKALQHGQFFKSLESAQDGFSTVAEYFGRAVFSPVNDPRVVAAAARDAQHAQQERADAASAAAAIAALAGGGTRGSAGVGGVLQQVPV
eukprot:m51a1_g7858 putative vacuolar protein sorting-associated protein 11 homolog (936) ;mRNA; r:250849-254074